MKNNIKKLRQKKGLSQNEFGEKIQMAQSGISNLENGNYNPTLSVLLKILEVLDCTFEELGFLKKEEEIDNTKKRKIELDIIAPIKGVKEATEMTIDVFKKVRVQDDAPQCVILTDMKSLDGDIYHALMVNEAFGDTTIPKNQRAYYWTNYSQFVTNWNVE